MFRLASLFVDITARDDQFQKQIGGVRKQLDTVGVAIGSAVGNLVASAIASASSALASFIGKGVSGAVELQDQLSALNDVFGGSASVITAEADLMAKKFGVVKTEFVDAAKQFGGMFKGTGSSVADAAALGNQLTKLGLDMKSFKGGMTTNAEAVTVLSAAMRGEYDSIDRFGVLMNAEKVEAEALALGLAKSSKQVDDHAKMQARLSIIMKQTVDQQGNLAKTATDTGNSWSKVTGTLQNTATTIGEALMPAIDTVVAGLGFMTTQISDWVELNKGRIQEFARAVGYALVVDVPNAFDTLVAGLAVASFKVEEWGANAMAVFATVPENLSRIGDYIANNWRKIITDALNAVIAVFRNLGDNLANLGSSIADFLRNPTGGFHFNWQDLLKDFKGTADQLPEMLRPNLVSMDAQIAAVGENLEKQTAARVKAVEAAGKAAAAPGKAAAAAAAAKSTDFKSVLSGASEFALKMRASIYESGNKIPEQQLAAQNRTALASETTAAKVGAMAFTRLK